MRILFLIISQEDQSCSVVQLQLNSYMLAGRTQQRKGANAWYFVSHLLKTSAFSPLLWFASLRKALVLWMDLCMGFVVWNYVQVVKQKQISDFPLKQNFNFMYHLYYLLKCEKHLIASSPRTDAKSRPLGQSYRCTASFPTGLKCEGGCCSLIKGIRASGLFKCVCLLAL